MKTYHDEFLHELAGLAPLAPVASKDTEDHLYNLIKMRAKDSTDTQGANKRNSKKLLLIAAAVTVGLLAMAVTFYSVSDAFHDVLNEQNSEGEKVPISSLAPIVEKSGFVVEKVSKDQGVAISVRAVIGHANGLKVLIDITGPDDKPLAIKQPDGTFAQGDISFHRVMVYTNDSMDIKSPPICVGTEVVVYLGKGLYGRGKIEAIDNNRSDNKTTLLLDIHTEIPANFSGKTLYLTLENLMQDSMLNGTEVGMKAGELYQLLGKYNRVSDSDFVKSGYIQDIKTGETIFKYKLNTDSELQLPLAKDLPGYYVTNAAVRDNVLYLRGTAPLPKDASEVLPDSALKNLRTGDLIKGACGVTYNDNYSHDTVIWNVNFKEIPSQDALNDYVLVLKAGQSFHPLLDGKWNFTIPIDFKNTTKVQKLDKDFMIESYTMHAKELTVSPYYMSIAATIDKKTYYQMKYREHPVIVENNPIITGLTAWDKIKPSVTITMKDHTTISIPCSGSGGSAEYFNMEFIPDVVIDTEQIQSITFGDLVVELNE